MYQSSISRAQFNTIKPILEGARRKTAPRKHDLYVVFNAVLYVLKNGCSWRDLPEDFPDYRVVYYYFSLWRAASKEGDPSLLDEVLKKIDCPRAS